jgi:hypothetical protein
MLHSRDLQEKYRVIEEEKPKRRKLRKAPVEE